MRSIIKTAFLTSLVAYVIFLLADYARPGFVSYVFSVHLFLIPTIAFGVWLAWLEKGMEPPQSSSVFGHVRNVFIGLLLLVLFWLEGSFFGDIRLLLSVGVFFLPWIAVSLLKETT